MANQFLGKRVPWVQFEEYKKLHQDTMTSWEYMNNYKMLEKEEIESKLPAALYQLHKLSTKVLRDNNIIQYEEEKRD